MADDISMVYINSSRFCGDREENREKPVRYLGLEESRANCEEGGGINENSKECS